MASKKRVERKGVKKPRKTLLQKNHIDDKKKVYNWVCLECGISDEASLNPRCPVCNLRMDAGRVIKW